MCEKQLIDVLNYDKFELVKKLWINRAKIYFCTLLGQAQSQQEKSAILSRMKESEQGRGVLSELEHQGTMQEKQRLKMD